jgi:digeranylgeranylglycerophospholipid reductase
MEDVQDVIVVGGGPVGSFAALILSKLGKKVTVFEEHSEIGCPVHCAGHLSITSLRNLGLYPLPDKIIENEFSQANFYSYSGFSFPVILSKPVTCAVNRELFDKYIFIKAKEAGVSFHLNSSVQSLVIENEFVRGVKTNQGEGKEEIFRAKIVLDAEGISSRLLKQTGLVPLNPKRLVYAVQAEVENVKQLKSNEVHIYFGKAYAPGFYAWLIPKLDGSAKIGLATNKGNPNDFLQRLITNHPIVSQYLTHARIKNKEFHSITLGGPIPKLYLNGFMALGDVASQVKPTTGGGVVFGLNSSIIAAQVASLAINNNNVSSNFLKLYQNRYMKNFSFDFSVMLKIRSFLNSLSDEKLDRILRFCKKIRLNKTIKNIDEIDLQGRTIFKTLIKPTVSVALVYLLINYLVTNGLNLE